MSYTVNSVDAHGWTKEALEGGGKRRTTGSDIVKQKGVFMAGDGTISRRGDHSSIPWGLKRKKRRKKQVKSSRPGKIRRSNHDSLNKGGGYLQPPPISWGGQDIQIEQQTNNLLKTWRPARGM